MSIDFGGVSVWRTVTVTVSALDRARSDARLAMTGATLAAVDVFLAYISVVIFFLSVSLLLFCYWRYSGRVRRALMPRDGRTDGRTTDHSD